MTALSMGRFNVPLIQSLQCAWQCWEMLGQSLRNGYCTLCLTKLPCCPWSGVSQLCVKLSCDSVSVCSKQDGFQGKSHIHANSWMGTNKKDVLKWLNLDISLGSLLPSAFHGCSQDLVSETSRQLWQSGGPSRVRKITFGKAAHVCASRNKAALTIGVLVLFFFFGYVWRHINLAKLKRFPGASAHPKLVAAPADYCWGQ